MTGDPRWTHSTATAQLRARRVGLPWLFVLLAPLAGAEPGATSTHSVRVILETSMGDIELELDGARAPLTTANFLRYVKTGRYDGGRFHRSVTAANQPKSPVKIAVIQGGEATALEATDFPPIRLERTRDTGLTHRDGTLSMARDGADTATSDFFICVGEQPELDFGGHRNPDGQGFAAFGRVVRGMDVVRRIWRAPVVEQTLAPPVSIHHVRVTRASPDAGGRD